MKDRDTEHTTKPAQEDSLMGKRQPVKMPPLIAADKISIETACLVPMLILCFIYTPISWFTFDGLLGPTPYFSILFLTIITLTYNSKIQALILSSYSILMLGLTIHWLVTWPGERNTMGIVNILVAYILTAVLIVYIIELVKRKNLQANKQIMDLSMRDDLTGLLNRRIINQVFDKLESIFIKEGLEYAVIIIDIDEFKKINDLYGHNLGDSVLKVVAECVQNSIRSTDHAFRYGGDEFLLILPNMDKAIVEQTCKRIKKSLYETQYGFQINVSIGYALRSESSNAVDTLELADKRMYQVKRKGKI